MESSCLADPTHLQDGFADDAFAFAEEYAEFFQAILSNEKSRWWFCLEPLRPTIYKWLAVNWMMNQTFTWEIVGNHQTSIKKWLALEFQVVIGDYPPGN